MRLGASQAEPGTGTQRLGTGRSGRYLRKCGPDRKSGEGDPGCLRRGRVGTLDAAKVCTGMFQLGPLQGSSLAALLQKLLVALLQLEQDRDDFLEVLLLE